MSGSEAISPQTPTGIPAASAARKEHISKIEDHLPGSNISKRSVAVMILSGDKTLKEWLIANLPADKIDQIESIRNSTEEKYSMPLSYIISQQRLRVVDGITEEVLTKTTQEQKGISAFIGEITTHPVWGIPFLLFVIYVLYEFVGRLGAGVMVENFFEDVIFGQYLNPWAGKIVMSLIPVKFLQELLLGPYGIISMALTYAAA